MMLLPLIPNALLIAAGAFASWSDTFHRRIPNWLSAATAVAGLITGFLLGGLPALGSQAAHAAIALIVGMLLFRIGLFGGGDAKFYAAVAAWFRLAQATMLLVYVTLCGLAVLVVWFVLRRIQGKPIRQRSNKPGDSLPYGIAIAGGAIAALFMIS